jgi:fructose-1,6-bisphosphatase/inositol monophosphatase family enzyme
VIIRPVIALAPTGAILPDGRARRLGRGRAHLARVSIERDTSPSDAGQDTGRPDITELLAIAVDAAAAAARLVRDQRPEHLAVTATKSSATDVVTEMDQASEALLVARIRSARPADGFLGEEGAHEPGRSGVVWVIDPIDGTVNYLYGIPTYAVSVGVQVDGRPVAGVVHNPVSGEVWTASRGNGAFLNGREVRVNEPPELAMALVATGFGYAPEARARQAEVVRALLPRIRDIRRAGSASLDLCAVATGRADAYFEQGAKPWDLAAGALIAQEAGAVVGGLAGRSAGEDLVIAAPAGLFAELEAMLAELGADRT